MSILYSVRFLLTHPVFTVHYTPPRLVANNYGRRAHGTTAACSLYMLGCVYLIYVQCTHLALAAAGAFWTARSVSWLSLHFFNQVPSRNSMIIVWLLRIAMSILRIIMPWHLLFWSKEEGGDDRWHQDKTTHFSPSLSGQMPESRYTERWNIN